jgi:chromosome segregation ATPase
LREVQFNNSQLQEQLEAMTGHLNAQDREMQGLLSKFDNIEKQKALFEQEASVFTYLTKKYHVEAANLSSDLAVLTRENQILNTDSSKVAAERDRLKAEVKECERQLQYLDQLIRSKDSESHQLMQSYRKLISDHEKQEHALLSANDEVKNSRMDIIMRDKTVQKLQKELETVEQDLSQAKIDLVAYEKQCSSSFV